MAKGSYTINSRRDGNASLDRSFVYCILTMLAFLFVLVAILGVAKSIPSFFDDKNKHFYDNSFEGEFAKQGSSKINQKHIKNDDYLKYKVTNFHEVTDASEESTYRTNMFYKHSSTQKLEISQTPYKRGVKTNLKKLHKYNFIGSTTIQTVPFKSFTNNKRILTTKSNSFKAYVTVTESNLPKINITELDRKIKEYEVNADVFNSSIIILKQPTNETKKTNRDSLITTDSIKYLKTDSNSKYLSSVLDANGVTSSIELKPFSKIADVETVFNISGFKKFEVKRNSTISEVIDLFNVSSIQTTTEQMYSLDSNTERIYNISDPESTKEIPTENKYSTPIGTAGNFNVTNLDRVLEKGPKLTTDMVNTTDIESIFNTTKTNTYIFVKSSHLKNSETISISNIYDLDRNSEKVPSTTTDSENKFNVANTKTFLKDDSPSKIPETEIKSIVYDTGSTTEDSSHSKIFETESNSMVYATDRTTENVSSIHTKSVYNFNVSDIPKERIYSEIANTKRIFNVSDSTITKNMTSMNSKTVSIFNVSDINLTTEEMNLTTPETKNLFNTSKTYRTIGLTDTFLIDSDTKEVGEDLFSRPTYSFNSSMHINMSETVPSDLSLSETHNLITEPTTTISTQVYNTNKFEIHDCLTMNLTEKKGPPQCVTDICKMETSYILSKMNHSYDYCQDFNEYACGNLKYSPFILENDPTIIIRNLIKERINEINESSSKEEKTVKKFYKSCVKYRTISEARRIKKAKAELNLIGSFVDSKENTITLHTITTLIKNLIEIGSFPLFNIGHDIDHRNTSQLTLSLTLNSKEMSLFRTENDEDKKCKILTTERNSKYDLGKYYSDYTDCMKNASNYIETIKEALEKFNLFHDDGTKDDKIKSILRDVEKIMKIQYKNIPSVPEINQNYFEKKFVSWTLDDLQTKFKLIDWTLLIGFLFERRVSSNTIVQIYFDEYFTELFNNWNKKDEIGTLHNALLAHFAYDLYVNFVKTDDNDCKREDYCVEITSRLVPDVVSNIFIKNFNKEMLKLQKDEVEKWHSLIKKTYLEELEEVYCNKSINWMDEPTYQSVKNKINKLSISLPSLLSTKYLPESIRKIPDILSTDTYFGNAMTLIKRRQILIYSIYNMPSQSDLSLWLLFSKSFGTKPIYIYPINTLVIPQIVLFNHNKKLPDAIILSRLGFIIAKALSQAFDGVGKEFNYLNKKQAVMSTDSLANYETVLQPFKEGYYDAYVQSHKEDKTVYSYSLSETKTLDSKFSDISAVRLALESLKRYGDKLVLLWGGYSAEQIFFISLAQEFCTKKKIPDQFPLLYESTNLPPFLRVKVMFSNTEEFNSAYPCRDGSPMKIIKLMMMKPFPYMDNSENEMDY